MTYTDYREVGGTWIPYLVESENPFTGRERVTIERVTFGVEAQPGAFSIDEG